MIKKIVFNFLYYSGIVHIICRFVLPKIKNLPTVIFIYHRLTTCFEKEVNSEKSINHPLKNFLAEMEFLKKYFKVISLDKALTIIRNGKNTGKPTVAITFDDGYEDNYTLALPVLSKLKLPATVFLSTAYINTFDLPVIEEIERALKETKKKLLKLESKHIKEEFDISTLNAKRKTFRRLHDVVMGISNKEQREFSKKVCDELKPFNIKTKRFLTWNEIKKMKECNITLGAHTATHPVLSQLEYSEAVKEIDESKRTITAKMGMPAKHFAYPFGYEEAFTEELKDYCKGAGFLSVCTAIYGTNHYGADPYFLKRLSPGNTLPQFVVNLVRNLLRK